MPTVTKELKSFLEDNIPKPVLGNPGYQIAVADGMLAYNIIETKKISVIAGELVEHVMRGLRVKIDKFIVGFEPGDLKKAQLNLARSYCRQNCACKESFTVQRIWNGTIADKIVVVPHKFKGLFIARVGADLYGARAESMVLSICTINFGNFINKPTLSSIEDLGTLAKKMVTTKKSCTYPLVYHLIELALLLPVATASVEKVFSAISFIKTDLRNRMGDEWMNDSMVVYIEKDVFAKIDSELILDRFQKMASCRIQLPSRDSI